MSTDLKRILVVEDSDSYQVSFFQKLMIIPEVSIVFAASSIQFFEIWEKNKEFDLIYMDACLDSNELDTIPLIKKIRETSNCPIVAATSKDRARQEMMRAGCDYEFNKLHFNEAFVEQFKKILNLKLGIMITFEQRQALSQRELQQNNCIGYDCDANMIKVGDEVIVMKEEDLRVNDPRYQYCGLGKKGKVIPQDKYFIDWFVSVEFTTEDGGKEVGCVDYNLRIIK